MKFRQTKIAFAAAITLITILVFGQEQINAPKRAQPEASAQIATKRTSDAAAQEIKGTPGITACQSLPPGVPSVWSKSTNNHVEWLTTMANQFSEYDSIWVECHLKNYADRRVGFSKIEPVIAELTTEKGLARKAILIQGSSLKLESIDRTPGRGEDAYSFRADLKAYFGKLEPGKYNLRFVWLARSYAMEGMPDFAPADLESADREFEITAVDLEAIEKQIAPAYLLISRRGAPEPLTSNSLQVGTFSHSALGPRFIPYLAMKDKSGADDRSKPLPAIVQLVRFGAHAMTSAQFRTAEIGLALPKHPLLKVQPGTKVDIVLLDWQMEGDGVYCYMMNIYQQDVPGQAEPTLLGQAMSKPFIVDRIRVLNPPSGK